MDRREKLEYVAKKKPFAVWDLLVIAAILAVGMGVFFLVPRAQGSYAEVYSDNRLVVRLPLSSDTEYTVRFGDGYNVIVVKSGAVYVRDASCGDHSCLGFGKKNRGGEQIVCLPNRLVIRITGSSPDGDTDGVVG